MHWSERAGIEELSPLHVRVARAAGRRVRLVASCTRDECGITAALAPRRLEPDHPLASVGGAGNALVVTLDDGRTILLAGTGAGRSPTTESVIGDLLEIARDAGLLALDHTTWRTSSRTESSRLARAPRGKESR